MKAVSARLAPMSDEKSIAIANGLFYFQKEPNGSIAATSPQ